MYLCIPHSNHGVRRLDKPVDFTEAQISTMPLRRHAMSTASTLLFTRLLLRIMASLEEGACHGTVATSFEMLVADPFYLHTTLAAKSVQTDTNSVSPVQMFVQQQRPVCCWHIKRMTWQF